MTARIFPPIAVLAFASLPALGQDASAVPDANGDGSWSMEEIQAVSPDLTKDAYAAIDRNADGVVDADELVAAMQAGVIKPAG